MAGSTTIFLTRPFTMGLEAVETVDECLRKRFDDVYLDVQNVMCDGDVVAVCNTFSIDGCVDWTEVMKAAVNADCDCRLFIEIWFDDEETDMTEHTCVGIANNMFVAHRNFWESYMTSDYPEITPEYLSEDYAVAFLNDLCECDAKDACSYERVKW